MNPTGQDLLKQAEESIGDEYVYGANVDISDPNWPGPWDCAEKITYDVYWVTKRIFGCIDNKAAKTPGAILLRYRQGGKHIVFVVGNGTTIEAKSEHYGVCRGKVGNLASWDYGILIPGVDYGS